MKHPVWIGLAFLGAIILSPCMAQNPDASQVLTQVKALKDQGNFRDAADLAKPALLKPDATVELLDAACEVLMKLQAANEWEETIEAAVKAHSKNAAMLLAAAAWFQRLPHGGSVVENKFERGSQRDQGRQVQTTLRDRVRALQLLESAMRAARGGDDQGTLPSILHQWIEALSVPLSGGYRWGRNAGLSHQAWRLQHLTALSQLPDYDDQSGLDAPATGLPADPKGNPVFFKAPASWEVAASDGERLMWTLQELTRLNPLQGRDKRARLAKDWFSVQSLAAQGIRFRPNNEDDESSTRNGIAALHTLKDDETVAKLATGAKRFALPPEWAFLNLFREQAEDEKETAGTRSVAWEIVAGELRDRRQYSRAAEAFEKAISLETDRNRINNLRLQLGQIRDSLGTFEMMEAQPAGREARLSVVFRNATKLDLKARKVDVAKLLGDAEAYFRSEPQDRDWQRANVAQIGQRLLQKDGEAYLGPVAHQWSVELKPRPNHWDKRVDIATPLKEAGAWFVEGAFNGGKVVRALVWIEDLVIVQTKQKDAGHYFVADAMTGAAVPGATVRFFGYKQEWKEPGIFRQKPKLVYGFKDFQLTSNEQGEVTASEGKVKDHQWLIVATTRDGRRAYLGFEGLWFGDGRERFGEQPRLYAITDRPVYRPGQEVKWKAWARMVGYDSKFNTNPFAHKSIQVTIWNPLSEKLVEKSYRADEAGGIDDALTLADDAKLGMYRISFEGVINGNHSFRVEEYKKPEFEVQVEAPTKPVALGDSFEVKVKADYYFGGPVKEGNVKYKVRRSTHTDRWFPTDRWDWLFGEGYAWRPAYYSWYPGARNWCFCMPRWPWMPWRSDPPELVASGEAPLNADGTFTVKVDTALAKELHGDEDHRYEIETEVTDPSRRTIFGKGSVLAARRPFEVYVWLDRGYYRAGEKGEVRVSARTLDGRTVKANGELRLLRVSYDRDGKPNEEEVASFDLKKDSRLPLRDDEASRRGWPEPSADWLQTVKWDRTGQYRLSVTLKDEAGHEIEGVSFTTVRGEGFEEGKDFRFDDLEVITQKDEYAPGEEVEVTLNTNRAGSTVALFLRAENGTYPAPVWVKLTGKSTTYRFALTEADQPNVFIDAYTVSDARVHQVTRQIVVPPKKRIATLEVIPDSETYLPRQNAKARVRVKDQDGKPVIGQVVLTAYDKALEYISGGSNQTDIRPFFWGWKRNHFPQVQDSLRETEVRLFKGNEVWMQPLGVFGGSVADDESSALQALGGFGVKSGRLSGTTAGSGGVAAMAMDVAAAPAAPAPATAGLMLAEGAVASQKAETGSEAPPPMIRSNLADSAVWVVNFVTDDKGEGEINFAMPDNLTTWKLRSWVVGPQTQVGEAAVEVSTRKNLMVRLQAPRFFVEKDEVVISANVHNEMDTAQEVKASLELEGGVLEFVTPSLPSLASLPPQSEKRLDWRVRVTGEGEAKVRVTALAKGDSDAMEMTFPAFTHGMLKTDSWSLALRPNQASGSITIKVPEERNPEQSRLEVRYSPTLAMALIDALPYLTDYPYGCTEQTLNRFLPTVITLRVLKDLGVDLKDVRGKRTNLNAQEIGDPAKRAKRWQGRDIKGRPKEPVFDEGEVQKMAKAGVDRLLAMRNGDGGWGWFPGGRESSAHITALVVHGLKAAEAAGFDINDGLMREGVTWLKRHEAGQLRRLRLPKDHKEFKPAPDNLDAFVHCVLVEHDAGDQAMRAMVFEQRKGLSRYNLALLGLACHQTGEKERRDMCLRNLRQYLKRDDENQTAYLELPDNAWWWFWYDDEIETQAAFLRLLSAVEPKGELAPRIAKYLLNNRRNGTYWRSTKDTAAVIEALAAFVNASGESKPQMTIEVLVDGKSQKQIEVTPDNLFSFDGTFVMKADALTAGEHRIELRKVGESPLYANAYLNVFSQEDRIPAAGLEVKARRKFYRLIEEKPDQRVAGSRGQVVTQQGFKYRREEMASDAPMKSGDLIEVELTIESKNDYEYVIIEDPKPAGFEPIDVQSGWQWDGLQAYQEFRDEKVAFFAERLPRGTHSLSYRVKAEIPGRFSALPTSVSAMYAPELKGNSDEWKARIEE